MNLHNDRPPSNTGALMTSEQLSQCSGISVMELGELVAYSALVPFESQAQTLDTTSTDDWMFSAQWLKPLCAASKLRNDFDLDMFTVAILLGNLQRIQVLEQSIHSMRQKMYRVTQENANEVIELTPDGHSQLDLFRNHEWRWS